MTAVVTAKNKEIDNSFSFQIKDSFTLLLVVCIVSTCFAILLCYYPGPKFLGPNFWPIFALFALLALGTGIKLLIRKPILQINKKGIQFFRSKIFIDWSDVESARIVEVEEGPDDSTEYLIVQYIDRRQSELRKIDFPLSGLMNKTAAEIIEAIAYFKH